jgi:hypothetical protein
MLPSLPFAHDSYHRTPQVINSSGQRFWVGERLLPHLSPGRRVIAGFAAALSRESYSEILELMQEIGAPLSYPGSARVAV